jgi:hypothetical protein
MTPFLVTSVTRVPSPAGVQAVARSWCLTQRPTHGMGLRPLLGGNSRPNQLRIVAASHAGRLPGVADQERSNGLSAAWGVVAAVSAGGAISVWIAAASPGSHFPIWPAYLLGLIAVTGLYMCFAALGGWWPARLLQRSTTVVPSQPVVTSAVTSNMTSRRSSVISLEALRALIEEGEAMQGRLVGQRGPLAIVPPRFVQRRCGLGGQGRYRACSPPGIAFPVPGCYWPRFSLFHDGRACGSWSSTPPRRRAPP